jgi:hypothetical protein
MRLTYLLVALYFISLPALAADDHRPPTQLRLFVGNLTTSPVEVNDELATAGLHKYSSLTTYGLEATYMIVPHLNIGARGEGKWQKVTELATPSSNPQNPYYGSIQQTAALAVVRLDVVTTPVVRLDVFGGAGTAKTSMDIRTSAGDSNYRHPMGTTIGEAGASVGVGWSNMYFLVEVGHEWNRVDNLSKTGATSSNVNVIDLSGTYVTVGLLFNGLPGWIHRK